MAPLTEPSGLGADVVDHYRQEREADRLEGWSLERLRTEELLARRLPPAPAAVLDVGGGAGVYASWLADRGHRVHLVDAMAHHVTEARRRAAGRFTAEQGDARALRAADGAFDVVLLMGPLYHLVDVADRGAALAEARRVVRAGGLLAVAAISRTASLLDGVARGFLREPAFRAVVEADLRDGQHRNPDPHHRPEWFTTAFFHGPGQLAGELRAAGLTGVEVFGVEGPAWLLGDRAAAPADPVERDARLWAARRAEADPDLIGLSAHLLAFGRAP